MNKNIQIGVLYYLQENSYIHSESLLPIQLGFSETGVDMGIQKDNTGDNRSERHPIYSEYSGIYWMWKNVSADYKGVFQHRRSLAGRENSPLHIQWDFLTIQTKVRFLSLIMNSRALWNPIIKISNHQQYVEEVHRSVNYISDVIDKGFDIVVPAPYHFVGFSVYEHFDEVVNRGLMGILKRVLENNYTQYYGLFKDSLNDSKMYYANISVMRNELFDEYCNFVFGVFDELEQVLINERYYINLYKERSMYRIFGYVGELLTNVFIRKKKKEGCKIKELWLLYDSSVKGNESTDYNKIKL